MRVLTRQGYGYHSAEALIGMATTTSTRPGVNPPTKRQEIPLLRVGQAVAARQGWPVTACISRSRISCIGWPS